MILSQPATGNEPPKKDPTTIKTHIQKKSIKGIKGIPRASSSGDQVQETALMNLTGLLLWKFITQTQVVKKDNFEKQKQTRRVSQIMGRQRNNPQSKVTEESSERVLNEIEASR